MAFTECQFIANVAKGNQRLVLYCYLYVTCDTRALSISSFLCSPHTECLTTFFFILSLLPLSIQITTEETHNATTKVISFEEWFNSTSKAQEELAGSETPVLTRSEVGLKLRPVGDYIKMLHRKPRPTPKPTPKASKNATASDNTTSSLEEDVEEEQDGESGEEETAQAKEQGEAKEEGDASSGEDAEGEL
jgi:hypothetical protein